MSGQFTCSATPRPFQPKPLKSQPRTHSCAVHALAATNATNKFLQELRNWPDQSDEPAPKGKMHSQINGKEQREPVQKEAVVEIAERAEPAKREGEKYNAGHIAQK